jgi:elongation factor Ts
LAVDESKKMELIKQLRERTSAGVMDCKRALEAGDWDLDRATAQLMEWGMASAEKRAGRVTAQGLVESYIHAGGRIGVIVEVNCETDFVARTEEFKALAHEIAMQVAASNPQVVSKTDMEEGDERPADQMALLEQPYIRDPSKTIRQLITETVAKTGENIQVRRFARFELGA